jgi:hypothetical protein
MARLWLIGGGVFVGALLVLSIVLALLRSDAEFPAGSPEAAVQTYLRALQDDDFSTAHNLFSADLRAECSLDDFVSGSVYYKREIANQRVVLESTTTLNESVAVTTRISRVSDSGPFGVSEYSASQVFTLRQEDGGWRFTKQPWPFFGCDRPIPAPALEPRIAEPKPTPAPVPTPSG